MRTIYYFAVALLLALTIAEPTRIVSMVQIPAVIENEDVVAQEPVVYAPIPEFVWSLYNDKNITTDEVYALWARVSLGPYDHQEYGVEDEETLQELVRIAMANALRADLVALRRGNLTHARREWIIEKLRLVLVSDPTFTRELALTVAEESYLRGTSPTMEDDSKQSV